MHGACRVEAMGKQFFVNGSELEFVHRSLVTCRVQRFSMLCLAHETG